MRALAAVPVVAIANILAWAEWMHWRASRRRLGNLASGPGRQAIVVLGCRNRGTRANYLNRYRVGVALRSIDSRSTETVLVFCGGGVGSEVPEADLLLEYARTHCGYDGAYVLDRLSRTTWENIANVVDILAGFDTVKIASNSMHAEKARAYLWKQRPDVAERLVAAKDYRLGEIAFVKPIAAVRATRGKQRLRATL
ncbi:YdcF family protein [Agreia bicolorata]|uniref:YdcF family protein n=1 Tax=Agreia bicolorata TaxID=110935 RepID=UPI000AF7A80C|nr:YdcF family protein [Agreia bicolorata]